MQMLWVHGEVAGLVRYMAVHFLLADQLQGPLLVGFSVLRFVLELMLGFRTPLLLQWIRQLHLVI